MDGRWMDIATHGLLEAVQVKSELLKNKEVLDLSTTPLGLLYVQSFDFLAVT